jgi:hypothetical protein
MATLSWLDIVESTLRTHRLPHAYRHRTLRELRDHAEDLLDHGDRQQLSAADEETLLTQRLGDSRRVAASVVQAYRQRHFAGRHRIITFVLGPVPLGLLAWFLFVGGLCLPVWVARACGANVYTDPFARYLNLVVWVGFNIVPLGIAIFYAWLAQRSAVQGVALLCSTTLLALFFGSFCGKIQLPLGGPGTGMIFFGVSSDMHVARTVSMIVAVGILILAKRYYQQRRQFA